MRELKGTWKDLFNGFMLALDLRKMFLGLCAIIFSLAPFALTAYVANRLEPDLIQRPESLVLGDIWTLCSNSIWAVYFSQHTSWHIWLPHLIGFIISMTAIWAFFGGAIARIAAYEIAKDGERLETGRALKFARKKFWAFFMAPFICVIGFCFFGFCNFAGGFIGRLADFISIGGPLVAILLPLALLSGFIMALIAVGTAAGWPLFTPAVAAEGTDAFDAVSRGFSYVYSRPWHYVWYQFVSAAYGYICVAFVILFAILLCHLGITAGGVGFDKIIGSSATKTDVPADDPARHQEFGDITRLTWSMILDKDYETSPYPGGIHPANHVTASCPYPWLMYASHKITGHQLRKPIIIRTNSKGFLDPNGIDQPGYTELAPPTLPTSHRIAAYIMLAWLVLTLGLAIGYLPSYIISSQTLIYFVMRKKVDGIEMNEVFEEADSDEKPLAPVPPTPPAGEKPPAPAPEKPAEPPKA